MTRHLAALAAAFTVASAVFLIWPSLDLYVSAVFYDATARRWLGTDPLPEAVRLAVWTSLQVATGVFFLLLCLALLAGCSAKVPARLWAFALASVALAPGLVANGLLKAYSGRARPRAIENFGGEARFTPPFQIADQCLSNCSFVSGEVAGVATILFVLWLLVQRHLGSRARAAALAACSTILLLASTLRLAAGAHFFSDVIFAIIFSAAITVGLWHAMVREAHIAGLTLANFKTDLATLRWRLTPIKAPWK